MNCPNCGFEAQEGETVCLVCRHPLTGEKNQTENVKNDTLMQEPKEYAIHIKEIGKNKSAVIKVVKEELGLSLKDAMEWVDLGVFGMENELSKARAEEIVNKLRAYGAVTDICDLEEAGDILGNKMDDMVSELGSTVKSAGYFPLVGCVLLMILAMFVPEMEAPMTILIGFTLGGIGLAVLSGFMMVSASDIQETSKISSVCTLCGFVASLLGIVLVKNVEPSSIQTALYVLVEGAAIVCSIIGLKQQKGKKGFAIVALCLSILLTLYGYTIVF